MRQRCILGSAVWHVCGALAGRHTAAALALQLRRRAMLPDVHVPTAGRRAAGVPVRALRMGARVRRRLRGGRDRRRVRAARLPHQRPLLREAGGGVGRGARGPARSRRYKCRCSASTRRRRPPACRTAQGLERPDLAWGCGQEGDGQDEGVEEFGTLGASPCMLWLPCMSSVSTSAPVVAYSRTGCRWLHELMAQDLQSTATEDVVHN